MRALLLGLLVAGVARADTATLVKQYAGRIVISPDKAPGLVTELAAHVKANAVAGDDYDVVKGPPWHLHLVGFLSADAPTVQLAIGEPKAEPLVTVDVAAKNRIVIANTDATVAAGFAAGKTYVVQLVGAKQAVLAKAKLTLRP